MISNCSAATYCKRYWASGSRALRLAVIPVSISAIGPSLTGTTAKIEDQRLVELQLLCPFEQLDRLVGKRNLVLAAGLHTVRRNRPDPLGEIDLRPRRTGRFAETRSGKNDEEHRQLDGFVDRQRLPGGQRLGSLGIREARPMVEGALPLRQESLEIGRGIVR